MLDKKPKRCKLTAIRRILLFSLFALIFLSGNSQNQSIDSITNQINPSISKTDTINSLSEIKKQGNYSAYFNHQEETFCKKMLRGTKYVVGFNLTMGAYLVIAPENVSKWGKKDKFKIPTIKNQYYESFTKPPVIDHDLWYINYIGHPYQGGYYYNTVRSQGASFWQSSLFCIGQSVLWEYGWEAGMEQPSIQDLITTPFIGILVGELSHVATVKLSKNGFRWYEKVLTCILNPSYAINNNFKFNKRKAVQQLKP